MSRAARRYYRTIVLGTAALATLIWAAVDQFGIPWEEMLELFLGTVILAGFTIGLAGLLVGAWIGLRKLLQKGRRGP